MLSCCHALSCVVVLSCCRVVLSCCVVVLCCVRSSSSSNWWQQASVCLLTADLWMGNRTMNPGRSRAADTDSTVGASCFLCDFYVEKRLFKQNRRKENVSPPHSITSPAGPDRPGPGGARVDGPGMTIRPGDDPVGLFSQPRSSSRTSFRSNLIQVLMFNLSLMSDYQQFVVFLVSIDSRTTAVDPHLPMSLCSSSSLHQHHQPQGDASLSVCVYVCVSLHFLSVHSHTCTKHSSSYRSR